jgi:hypothetical protein
MALRHETHKKKRGRGLGKREREVVLFKCQREIFFPSMSRRLVLLPRTPWTWVTDVAWKNDLRALMPRTLSEAVAVTALVRLHTDAREALNSSQRWIELEYYVLACLASGIAPGTFELPLPSAPLSPAPPSTALKLLLDKDSEEDELEIELLYTDDRDSYLGASNGAVEIVLGEPPHESTSFFLLCLWHSSRSGRRDDEAFELDQATLAAAAKQPIFDSAVDLFAAGPNDCSTRSQHLLQRADLLCGLADEHLDVFEYDILEHGQFEVLSINGGQEGVEKLDNGQERAPPRAIAVFGRRGKRERPCATRLGAKHVRPLALHTLLGLAIGYEPEDVMLDERRMHQRQLRLQPHDGALHLVNQRGRFFVRTRLEHQVGVHSMVKQVVDHGTHPVLHQRRAGRRRKCLALVERYRGRRSRHRHPGRASNWAMFFLLRKEKKLPLAHLSPPPPPVLVLIMSTRKRQRHESRGKKEQEEQEQLVPERVLEAIRTNNWSLVRTWVDYAEFTHHQADLVDQARALCTLARAWTVEELETAAQCVCRLVLSGEDGGDGEQQPHPLPLAHVREGKKALALGLVNELARANPLRITSAQVALLTKPQLCHHLCLVRFAASLVLPSPSPSPSPSPQPATIAWAAAPTVVPVERLYAPTSLATHFQTPAEQLRARRSKKDRDTSNNTLSPRARSAVIHGWDLHYRSGKVAAAAAASQ